MVTPPWRCPICKKTGERSAEHAIPKWMLGPDDEQIKVPICKGCNNRSNRLFEQPARELVKAMAGGNEVIMTPRQQVLVAAWLVKTILMNDLKDIQSTKTGPPSHLQKRRTTLTHLRYMLSTGSPPETTLVSIGAVPPGGGYQFGKTYQPWIPTVRPKFTSTGAIRHLVVRILIGKPHEVFPFEGRPEDLNWLITIWPQRIADSINWPPPLGFGAADLAMLHRSLQGDPRYGRVIKFRGPEK